MKHVSQTYDYYKIGAIEKDDTKVTLGGRLEWVCFRITTPFITQKTRTKHQAFTDHSKPENSIRPDHLNIVFLHQRMHASVSQKNYTVNIHLNGQF